MKLFAMEALAILGAALLAACAATTTPRTDEAFGESVSLLKAQQVLNPEASRNTDPVKGLDAKSAKGALESYHKSFGKSAGGGSGNSLLMGLGAGANASADK